MELDASARRATFAVADGLSAIDTVMTGRFLVTSAYLLDAVEPALVETGPSTSAEEDMDRLTALFRHARIEGDAHASEALLQLVIEADEQQRRRATPEEATYAVVDAGRVLSWARKAIERGDS